MGVIRPARRDSRAYFGCGGLAILGMFFWGLISCCLLLFVVGLSTELGSGDPELSLAYYTFSQIFVGALAFCLSMLAVVLVFGGFGIYRQVRKQIAPLDAYDLNTVLLFFFLFLGAMLLGAGLPVSALVCPGTSPLLKAAGVILGTAYFAYGLLMLWLLLGAYEGYKP